MSDPLAMAILGRPSGQARLITGTVATAADSNGVMKVDLRGSQVEAIILSSVTVSVGDSVLLGRDGSAVYVVGRLGVAPAPNPDEDTSPLPPRPSLATKTVTFRPGYAGSYRGGGWRTDTPDVVTGDWSSGFGPSQGRAFYGSGPSSLRKVVSVEWAQVVLRRKAGGVSGGQTLPLVLLTDKDRPASGAGSVRATTSGPSLAVDQGIVWALPGSWAEDLVSGAAGGLGIGTGSSSPYIRTHSPSTAPDGWVLSIRYTYEN